MKIIFLISLISFFAISCEKDFFETGFLVPKEELPEWLISSIESDEQFIKASPKYYLAYGAWTRSMWNNINYYQYVNSLSLIIIPPISELGDTLDILPLTSTDFHKEKCFTEYVWKAPKFRNWQI